MKNAARRIGLAVAWIGSLGLLAGVTAEARADLILTNGSFETGDFSGWTVSAGATGVSLSGGPGGYAPEDGNYYAYLGNVGGLGTISQTFATTAGQEYTLAYYLASNGTQPNEFKTTVNGATLFDQSNIVSQPYTLYTFNFTAAGTTSTLTFSERDDPNYLALDNVSVIADTIAAPEPSTIALAVASLPIGLVVWLRRRRAASA
jgi:Protein of unknown function (DUF642)